MKRLAALFFGVIVLIVTAPRLPAPISEETTPSPTAKPKPKRVTESQPDRSAKSPPPISSPTPSPHKRFAGTWSGVMPEVPWGNVQTELIVDSTESTMEWRESGNFKGSAKTQLGGNSLSARIAIGFTTAVWFISPHADGITADIRMTAFMNDDHAVFQRVSR